MKDHAATNAKRGRVLAVLFILMLAAFGGGIAINGCRRNAVAEKYKEQAEKAKEESTDLKRDRDKLDLKLAIKEKQVNIPVQSNAPPDKRLDIILEAFDSLVKSLPPPPAFELLINDNIIVDGREPFRVLLDDSDARSIRFGVRNLSEISAKVMVSFAAPLLDATNVIAANWRAAGGIGRYENQKLKFIEGTAWITKSDDFVPGMQLWTTSPFTISTNWRNPVVYSRVSISSENSKPNDFHVVFEFKN